MLRLVAYAPDGVQRFPFHRNELVIGSEPRCDVHLPYTGVAQQHARLSYDGNRIRIEDLGSRRGVLVAGERVREATLELLDEIRLGAVTLLVEDAQPDPRAGSPNGDAPKREPGPPRMTPERMLHHISGISRWVLSDVQSRTTSESLVEAVLEDFGGGVLLLLQGRPDALPEAGAKLLVATRPDWLGSVDTLVEELKARGRQDLGEDGLAFEGDFADGRADFYAHTFEVIDRSYVLVVALPRFPGEEWSPLASLRPLGNLLILGLVHHVGSYEPILPGQVGRQSLTLSPKFLLGPSEVTQNLLDLLESALDADVNVLLRGERGTGKVELARSLHQSGPRRRGPFIEAGCDGASPSQLEASLFGAEVPGKAGPVRREGKLALADGGTLFLDDVDRLPLPLQAKLVRFLRSGEVEPMGSTAAQKVDVRLIGGCRHPLDLAVAQDRVRVDLAYRLSQFTVDVPPLRERREDLQILIQAHVNRFCHETGKRMRGITVKATQALLHYDYPGNLAELENIVRQLVTHCPDGQPIDVSHLPQAVRLSTVQADSRVDTTSELDLERLVASTESAAIREALRRSGGNKSQAARTLGLSRNGLTMKMDRYGLKA
jgi:transcriptional regulator with AAA-type ATPase domain